MSGSKRAAVLFADPLGWPRWSRRAKPGKPQLPYRGLMRWHYFAGISFGVVTATWMFSGLMSMNPLKVDPPRRPESAQALVYAGKPLTLADFDVPTKASAAAALASDAFRPGVSKLVAGAADVAAPRSSGVCFAVGVSLYFWDLLPFPLWA